MSQAKTLDELYFDWLCDKVDGDIEADQYLNLLRCLHQTPFVTFILFDENRAEAGQELRWEFQPYYTFSQQLWLDQECSVLEMMVALADNMGFMMTRPTDECFWDLIRNLGLIEVTDDFFYNAIIMVEERIEQLVYRSYSFDGSGGLFPLRHPESDQTRVQLWDQMNSYILENDPLYR